MSSLSFLWEQVRGKFYNLHLPYSKLEPPETIVNDRQEEGGAGLPVHSPSGGSTVHRRKENP